MAVNTTVEVVMPAMGDSVSEGTILEWHKQEGDTVAEDETLVEISTDKVDAEVPAPAAGTVVKIHAAEGDTVARRRGARRDRAPNGAAPAAGAAEAEPRPPPRRPRAGESRRHHHAGDGRVGLRGRDPRVGQAAAATRSRPTRRSSRSRPTRSTPRCPRPPSGTIAEILAAGRRHRHVGQVIARMTAGDGAAAPPTAPAPEPTAAPEPAGEPEPTTRSPDGIKVTPVAAPRRRRPRRRPRERPRHRARPAASPRPTCSPPPTATAPAAPAPPPSRGATLIKGAGAMLARYMDESRSIPTATSFRTLTVTTLDARRKQLKEAGQQGLLHPPDRLRDRPRRDRADAGHGAPLRRDRRQAAPCRRRRRQPRHRRRRRAQGRRAHADGARSSATPGA